MINAKQELIDSVGDLSIKCAFITLLPRPSIERLVLKVDHSSDDLEKFLNSLDFVYNNGFGAQELYGYVWFTDGTWLERYEYDGSESWDHKSCPEIPKRLMIEDTKENT